MLYGHVYVAQVSVSHPEHFLKVLKEAESYDGPSMVTAYCPCRDHTVDLGDMVDLCREAVDSGYFPLYRYDPRLPQPFVMDSDIRQDVLPFLKKHPPEQTARDCEGTVRRHATRDPASQQDGQAVGGPCGTDPCEHADP